MRTVDDYLALIIPYHRGKPDFSATVTVSVACQVDDQSTNYSMSGKFDLDGANGPQLDVVGQWVGVSRIIPVPVPNPWFTLDAVGLGFDQGYWYEPYHSGTEFQVLDDIDYRRLIRARILCNIGDGSVASGQAVFDEFFSGQDTILPFVEDRCFAVDPPDPGWFSLDTQLYGFDEGSWFVFNPSELDAMSMTMALNISGTLPSQIDLAILASNILPIHPAGVRFEISVISTDETGGTPQPSSFLAAIAGAGLPSTFAYGGTAVTILPSSDDDIISTPLFGCDMENEYVSGFDVGVFGVSPQTLLGVGDDDVI